MDRTTYIRIGRKDYPMRFSLGASIELGKKFGDLSKMGDQMTKDSLDKQVETIVWILELLIKQGCAYKNLFEADMPVPDTAPVEDGKYVPATREEIELGVDLTEAREKIFECIGGGQKKEIEVKEKKSVKNAETM